MLAERAACKVGAGIAAPGKAKDEQDEEDGVIAVLLHGQQLLEPDERVEAEDHNARKHRKAAGFLVADGSVAHHQIDGIEQHHQERGGHDQTAAELITRQHDQEGVWHQNPQERPALLLKTEGRVNFMEGNEGDGRDDQIKDQGVKREQNANEDDDAHNGRDDSCFHRVLFLLWKSAGAAFIQMPPNRRERLLNSVMAASRSSRVKSGQRTSIYTSSE